jgi:FkbM family methyltransferase
VSLKDKLKSKIEKKIKKTFKILPEYDQKKRLYYYKSIGINFDKVLDIGAYIGSWKEMFQTIYPNADILMIEANTEKEEILKKKGKYLIALLGSEDNKIVDYYKCYDELISSGNGVFKENTKFKFLAEERKTIKLSSLLKNNNISYDLIKIDTQGSELEIIKGGLDIVTNSKFLLLELSIAQYNFNAPNYLEVLSYLGKIGFKLVDIFDLHYRSGSLIQIDGFFINTNFKKLDELVSSKFI